VVLTCHYALLVTAAGLQAKEARMRDLVALAEKREAACKDKISTLLASRSTMYEAAPARPACSPAPPVPAEEQEEEAEDDGSGETVEAAAAKIDEAEKRIELAQVCKDRSSSISLQNASSVACKSRRSAGCFLRNSQKRIECDCYCVWPLFLQAQFNKLRGVCVAAEQGMRSLVQRLSLALEAPALTIGPSVPTTAGHDGVHSAGQQAGNLSARLTSAGGLSSMSGSHGADGLRRSGAGSLGSAGHHRRPSRDHGLESVAQQSALASKAQR
jgi:hypothetical protein